MFRPTNATNFTRLGVSENVQNAGQLWSAQCQGVIDRFQVRQGDTWSGDIGRAVPKDRSEFGGNTKFAYDTDIWISYGFRVPQLRAPFDYESADPLIVIGQLHQTADAGEFGASPPYTQQLDPSTNTFTIGTRFSTEQPQVDTPNMTTQYSAVLTLGQWTRLVIHLKYSKTAGAGYLAVWRDGVSVVTGGSISLGYQDAVGPSWKYGIYRTAATQPMVVDYANMEVGTVDLTKRITSPLRIPGLLI